MTQKCLTCKNIPYAIGCSPMYPCINCIHRGGRDYYDEGHTCANCKHSAYDMDGKLGCGNKDWRFVNENGTCEDWNQADLEAFE